MSIHHKIMLWNIGSKALALLFLRRRSAGIAFSIRHRSWTIAVSIPVSREILVGKRIRTFDFERRSVSKTTVVPRVLRQVTFSQTGIPNEISGCLDFGIFSETVRDMETFIIIGMCFLCYELCEFLTHCTPKLRNSFREEKKLVFTVSENVESDLSPREVA